MSRAAQTLGKIMPLSASGAALTFYRKSADKSFATNLAQHLTIDNRKD
jgi:hypothetical protein